MKALLPRGAALEVLSGLVPDRKLAAQVLDYWLKKRAAEGGPLLARLWFEQPWKVRVLTSVEMVLVCCAFVRVLGCAGHCWHAFNCGQFFA